MRQFIGVVAGLLLSASVMAHPPGKPYTVHSVDVNKLTVVLNGSLVSDEYAAVLGDKTVITINDKQWSRNAVNIKPTSMNEKLQVSAENCKSVKEYMTATFPVGKEVQPVLEQVAPAAEIGTVYGPRSMGDVLVDGKSTREQLLKFVGAAKCQ
jgi:hypothetical protein